MDRTNEQWHISQGTDVYGADGEKVGRVVSVDAGYVVVEKGFFFPTDYYIPMDAFTTSDGERAQLAVTKDEALTSGWDAEPAARNDPAAGGVEQYDATGTATYAAARKDWPDDISPAAAADASAGAAATLGMQDQMGESDTSPGLAGDLTEGRSDPDDRRRN